jgi:2-polyprenyl-6-hydroxyphenyl methylase / 3-demethylubiquinone-9 3-methyltransferase
MNPGLVGLLRCHCGGSFLMPSSGGGALLRCRGCGAALQADAGIIRYPGGANSQSEEALLRDRQAISSWKPRMEDPEQRYRRMPKYRIEIEEVLAALEVRPGDIVLDVGAGAGKISLEVHRRGASVVAVDFSPECLKIIRDRCEGSTRILLVKANAGDLAMACGGIDKAVCTQVIQHIEPEPELQAVLDLISTALKAGGRALFTVYNYNRQRKKQGLTSDGHFVDARTGLKLFRRFFTPSRLEGLLQPHFRRVRIRGIYGRLPFGLIDRLGGAGVHLDRVLSRTRLGLEFGNWLLAVAER